MRFKLRELAPFCGEREADRDKGESNEHIPHLDTWNWVALLGDVENDNPEEADEEVCDHHRSKPGRTL